MTSGSEGDGYTIQIFLHDYLKNAVFRLTSFKNDPDEHKKVIASFMTHISFSVHYFPSFFFHKNKRKKEKYSLFGGELKRNHCEKLTISILKEITHC